MNLFLVRRVCTSRLPIHIRPNELNYIARGGGVAGKTCLTRILFSTYTKARIFNLKMASIFFNLTEGGG